MQCPEPEAAKRWKDHQLSSSPQPDFRSPSSGATWRNIANAATQRTPRTPPLFTVWTRADCEGTANATKSRSWFHFSVRGAPANKVLQFEIIMSNQAKLFSHDMRPVYRSLPSQPEWKPVKSATPWQVTYPEDANKEPEYDGFGPPPPLKTLVAAARLREREAKASRGPAVFSIYLTHRVETAGETLYFAFCYPHSYADTMARLAITDALFQQPTSHVAPHVAPMLLPRPPAWLQAIFDWLPSWLGGNALQQTVAQTFGLDTGTPPQVSSRRTGSPTRSPATARASSRVPTTPTSHSAVHFAAPPLSPFSSPLSRGSAAQAGTQRDRLASEEERETERSALARFNRSRLHGAARNAVLAANKAAREQARWSAESVSAPAEPPVVSSSSSTAPAAVSASVARVASSSIASSSSSSTSALCAASACAAASQAVTSDGFVITTPAPRIDSVKLAAEHERTNQELASAAAASATALLPSSTPKNIYYKRELLARSLEGRRIDLITITSHEGKAADGSCEEALPPPLMPEGGARPDRFPSKRYVLITSRVHPGETPASHVFDGLLAFLLRDDDPRAIALRDRFVFKLIPMLNPDGVYHGHYRADTRGANLNRKYASATYDAHPSIFASMAVARQLHASSDLMVVVDLHAHAGKRGCFFYGNQQVTQAQQAEAALFMNLVALNTRWLTLNGCTFFGAGSHDGSSRAAIFRLTGLPLVFTLECNYNRGNSPNELPRRHLAEGVDSGALTPDGPASREISPKYDPSCWGDIGKAIAIAVLDMSGGNPCSRLGPPSRRAEDLRRMRASVQIWAGRMQAQPNVCCPSDEDEAAEEEGTDPAVICEEADGLLEPAAKPPALGVPPSPPGSPYKLSASPNASPNARSPSSSAASTRAKLKVAGALASTSLPGKKLAFPPRASPTGTGAVGGSVARKGLSFMGAPAAA